MVEGDPSLGFLSEAVNGLTEAGGVVLGDVLTMSQCSVANPLYLDLDLDLDLDSQIYFREKWIRLQPSEVDPD